MIKTARCLRSWTNSDSAHFSMFQCDLEEKLNDIESHGGTIISVSLETIQPAYLYGYHDALIIYREPA